MTAGETTMDRLPLDPARPTASLDVPWGRWLVGALGFGVLTVGVFWWQFGRVPATLAVVDLRWRYGLLLLLLLPAETVLAATRMWLLCRVVHPGVRLWPCVQSEWANVAISLLTPSQSGGGPGLIYMLHRTAGVGVGDGVTLTVVSGLSTMAALLVLGLYSLAASGPGGRGPLFVVAAVTITVLSGAALLGAAWPDGLRAALAALSRAGRRLLRRPGAAGDWWPPDARREGPPADRMDAWAARLVDVLYAYRDGIRRFLRRGKACFAAACALSVGFLLVRALLAYLCVRFLGADRGGLREVLDAQIGLSFLVFFAPTPGGAGIAEGASLALMADIVAPPVAPYYTLLWRATTSYVAALAGFVCLGRTLARDAWQFGRHRPASR